MRITSETGVKTPEGVHAAIVEWTDKNKGNEHHHSQMVVWADQTEHCARCGAYDGMSKCRLGPGEIPMAVVLKEDCGGVNRLFEAERQCQHCHWKDRFRAVNNGETELNQYVIDKMIKRVIVERDGINAARRMHIRQRLEFALINARRKKDALTDGSVPGVWQLPDGSLAAWDYDPAVPLDQGPDTIVVTESDINDPQDTREEALPKALHKVWPLAEYAAYAVSHPLHSYISSHPPGGGITFTMNRGNYRRSITLNGGPNDLINGWKWNGWGWFSVYATSNGMTWRGQMIRSRDRVEGNPEEKIAEALNIALKDRRDPGEKFDGLAVERVGDTVYTMRYEPDCQCWGGCGEEEDNWAGSPWAVEEVDWSGDPWSVKPRGE